MSITINIGSGAAPASATVHQNGSTADAPAADHPLDGGGAPLSLDGAGDGQARAGAYSHAALAADAASAGTPPEWLLQAISDAESETGASASDGDGGSASA